MSGTPAAFVDRDGTIMRDASYIADPELVELLPGAAAAIRRLNERGVPVVVVTNQSGIARGWLSEEDYSAVQQRLADLLRVHGASLSATYMCPHHPDLTGPCECRKPGLLLYRQAAMDLGLDPARSVFIGDRLRDVAPAAALGGTGILLDVESTPADDLVEARARSIRIVPSLGDAVDIFLAMLPAVI